MMEKNIPWFWALRDIKRLAKCSFGSDYIWRGRAKNSSSLFLTSSKMDRLFTDLKTNCT
jgi:hypothetical protein